MVALQSGLSAHAKLSCWPPASVSARLGGSDGPVPPAPLFTLGLPRDTVRELFGVADMSAWWDVSFEMGRAPVGSEFRAVWRALFE